MNSWTNPQTIVTLCGAFAALVTAIGVAWHSINTRAIANTASTRAVKASINALNAISIANTPKGSTPPPIVDNNPEGFQ